MITWWGISSRPIGTRLKLKIFINFSPFGQRRWIRSIRQKPMVHDSGGYCCEIVWLNDNTHWTSNSTGLQFKQTSYFANFGKVLSNQQGVTSKFSKTRIISSFYVFVSKVEFFRTTALLPVEKYRLDRRPIDTTISTERSSRFRSICNHIRI